MAPEILNQLNCEKLLQIAQRIEALQKNRKWSDAKLESEVSTIGSTKTYRKILAGDFSEMNIDRQLANYESAILYFENLGNSDADDVLYEDIFAASEARRVYMDTVNEKGIARCVFMIGASGTGKSSARLVLQQKFNGMLRLVEATEGWNGSPMAFLGAILRVTDSTLPPIVLAERFDKVVAKLNETKLTFILEEGHHLGVKNLNIIKTLINQTPTVFFIIANDTLWKRMESNAYEDISQLKQNRLAEKIDLGKVVREDDVKVIAQRRVKWEDFARIDLSTLIERANSYGRLAFVREVCQRLNKNCGRTLATQADLITAINAEVKSR